MDLNNEKNSMSFEHFKEDVQKCKKELQKIEIVFMVIGILISVIGALIGSFSFLFWEFLTEDLLVILIYSFTFIGLIFMVIGFVAAMRTIYFKTLLMDERLLCNKWEKVTSGQHKYPSVNRKKMYIFSIICCIVLMIVILVATGIIDLGLTKTPKCNHEACAEYGPFPCYGKNNTCPNKTYCYKDLYCDYCD